MSSTVSSSTGVWPKDPGEMSPETVLILRRLTGNLLTPQSTTPSNNMPTSSGRDLTYPEILAATTLLGSGVGTAIGGLGYLVFKGDGKEDKKARLKRMLLSGAGRGALFGLTIPAIKMIREKM